MKAEVGIDALYGADVVIVKAADGYRVTKDRHGHAPRTVTAAEAQALARKRGTIVLDDN
jgi:hypothetical protein